MTLTETIDTKLADAMAGYYDDPLGFVMAAFPWGEPGPLLNHSGPDDWQREFLTDWGNEIKERKFDGVHAVLPIRMARASGHGIGKGVLSAFIAAFILSTRPDSIGTVTANTFPQLETKTWATIQKWMGYCITARWFEILPSIIYRKGRRASWFVTPQTCREENSEAFAGQHSANSTSWYIFDESSNIPSKIFEVADGGLSDGESMIFAFGNPTRNQGEFHSICFGKLKNKWLAKSIDSRECRFTNKEKIAEDLKDWGEDSDRFRVRVRGLPPAQGDMQFIGSDLVYSAQRHPPASFADDPLVAGLDVARGGEDWNVVRFRKGMDGKSIPPIRIPGEQTRDSMVLVTKLSEVLSDPRRKIAMLFVDSAFGGPVVNRLRQLGYRNIQEINFASASPDPHQANMRAYMWNRMKEWLQLGGGIPDKDQNLEEDLTGPGYHTNNRDQLVIESKEDMAKRGLHSTDDGDALALTFARPVMPPRPQAKDEFDAQPGKWS